VLVQWRAGHTPFSGSGETTMTRLWWGGRDQR